MGSCISKCKPKKKIKKENCKIDKEFCYVHDKLVISQAPMVSSIHKPVSPSPSAASSTSFSSVSGGISCNTSTEFSMTSTLSSSSSSCSSSLVPISKDRSSFSNEFLWACAKENPQIIGRNVIKGSLDHHKFATSTKKVHQYNSKYNFPAVVHMKQAIPDSHGGTTPKKRARANSNSPTLVRQKSFRRDPDKVSYTNSTSTYNHLPHRTLMRSPSPSRIFNGETLRDSPMNAAKEMHSRISTIPKTYTRDYLSSSSSMRRENLKTPPSPHYEYLSKSGSIVRTRDALISQQVGLRNGKSEVEEKELDNQDLEAMIVDDIRNPLIALDCFIFL